MKKVINKNNSEQLVEKTIETLKQRSTKLEQWQKIESQINRSRRIVLFKNIASVASVFIVSLACFIFLQTDSKTLIEYHTQRGEQKEVLLPDGSKVKMNSNSSLRFYEENFVENRDVEFEGEGYFDVEKSNYRFQVKLNEAKVVVLGTKFNIDAYENEKNIIVTLVSGKINFQTSEHSHILKPYQQILFNRELGKMKLEQVQAEDLIAWVNNNLVFDSMPLSRVSKLLIRKFGKNIKLNAGVENIEFSGEFVNNEKLNDILTIIQLTANITTTMKNDTIFLTTK
jgi:ferric-dicitrate binding protein FerR (iron transport regulator)